MLRSLLLSRLVGVGQRLLAAVLVVGAPLCLVAASDAGAAQTTALAVQVATPARAVHGTDGRQHVDYDLVITNSFTAPAKLVSLRVHGGGKVRF